LEEIEVLRDKVINTVALGIGEMVDGTPFCGMFLRDLAHRVNWRLGIGGSLKNTTTCPRLISLARFVETTLGC